ncbi:hypothetical protein TeGR_g6978 [Tetraparma gracilis]|uniref:Ubiquitin-like domain-containing protein n=1 Tax=Tetraparma gracilis TaxID=2962635 RepID=A0ABQ6N8V6_9STRA|nr:hypothetical protein TeGR_g6978 [Tetraparma gracilis]
MPEILYMLTDSGKKAACSIPSYSIPLSTLKSLLAESSSIPAASQRLFLCGRELKTDGRSLEGMGFSRYEHFYMHLMNTKPTIELSSPAPAASKPAASSSSSSSSKRKAASKAAAKPATGTGSDVICLDSSSDDDAPAAAPSRASKKKARKPPKPEEVITLD